MKLAALGRLSAGIAHEIRNPLSAIRHASQLLAESTQLGPEDQRLLEMILRQTVRIDRIISDVLGLSRPRRAQPQSLLLREFLERSIGDYREAMPSPERTIDFGEMPEGLRVRFDPDHLRQVLHNLWHNSFEHGTRGGQPVRVRLEAGRLNPGQRPYLDIIDDGPGIPAAVREQLFEPFFTTANKGTGLGLYLSRELCEYNQARLSNLARDAGAQFRITFTAG
jgi:two-component system sensor histidine kinase PilS (NtrC family)